MTGNILFDSKIMFKHACAFVDCAFFCEKEPNNIVVRTQWYTIPGIVNSAFACEVFIKSLLIYSGVKMDKIKKYYHELDELWDLLRKKDKEVCKIVKNKMEQLFNPTSSNFFDENLKVISGAFKTWRYIYEYHEAKINVNYLRCFRQVLREVCCEKYYNMSWSDFVSQGSHWETEDENN